MQVYPTMFQKTNVVRAFYPGFPRNCRVEKEGVMGEKERKKRGPQNMQVYPTICMKTKGGKKEPWVSPTMLMKTSMLSVLSYDVYENKKDEGKVSGARYQVSGFGFMSRVRVVSQWPEYLQTRLVPPSCEFQSSSLAPLPV